MADDRGGSLGRLINQNALSTASRVRRSPRLPCDWLLSLILGYSAFQLDTIQRHYASDAGGLHDGTISHQ